MCQGHQECAGGLGAAQHGRVGRGWTRQGGNPPPWREVKEVGRGAHLHACSCRLASRKRVPFALLPAADLHLPPALLQVVEAPDGSERLSGRRRLAKRLRFARSTSSLGRPAQQRRARSCHARPRIGHARGERCRLHRGRWERRTNKLLVASPRELKYWHEPITLRYIVSS